VGSWKATQDARRAFTASYLNMTRFGHSDGPVNWISAQSRPTLLPPYSAGAATSSLMQHLEPSHNNVQPSQAEKQRVACWIDLGVPFCGSYTEANQWDPPVRRRTCILKPSGDRDRQPAQAGRGADSGRCEHIRATR
jgi:hypothetical protein